jgi:uncharacterized protein
MFTPSNDPTITNDDKLWAALAYVLTPITPIIIMLMEDKKNRPFLRSHNAQALAWGVAMIILSIILGATVVLACLAPFVWLPQLFFAYKAYQGNEINLPFISDFVRKQGWA